VEEQFPIGSLNVDGVQGWLMIWLSETYLTDFHRLGVCSARVTIQMPAVVSGIAFPCAEKAQVEEYLQTRGLTMHPYCWATDMPDTYLVEFVGREFVSRESQVQVAAPTVTATESVKEAEKAEVKRYGVRLEAGPEILEEKEFVDEVVKCLLHWANTLKRHISIISLHGNYDDGMLNPVVRDCIRIVVWPKPFNSTGTPGSYVASYGKVFGYSLLSDGQSDGIEAEEMLKNGMFGEPMFDEDGVLAATVRRNVIYIPYDLFHADWNTVNILNRILKEYEYRFRPTEDAVDGKELAKDHMKVAVQKSLNNTYRRIRSCLAGDIDNEKYNIARKNEEIRAATAKLCRAIMMFEEINSLISHPKDVSWMAEKILEIPKVVNVREAENNKGIVVETDLINFTYQGREYLGHWYQITLNPIDGKVSISVLDDIPLVDGSFIHPHINREGTPCFGNIGEGVYKLLAELEYPTVIGMIVDFLTLTNEGDWYASPKRFLLADSPEAAVYVKSWREKTKSRIAGTPDYSNFIFDASDKRIVSKRRYAEEEEDDRSWTCPNCGERYEEYHFRCSECDCCESCCPGCVPDTEEEEE